jgi:hypothetical protein
VYESTLEMATSYNTGNPAGAVGMATLVGMANQKIHVRWETPSRLWRAVVCVATAGLFACIAGITLATIAPTLVPGLAMFIYTFYRLAVGCLLTALFASFLLIFSITWVPGYSHAG